MDFEEAKKIVYGLYKKSWGEIEAYGLGDVEEALVTMHRSPKSSARDKQIASWLNLKLTFEEA